MPQEFLAFLIGHIKKTQPRLIRTIKNPSDKVQERCTAWERDEELAGLLTEERFELEPQQYSMYLELVQAFEWVHSDRFRDLRKLLAFNEKDELNPLILALVKMLAPHYKYFSTFGGINHGLHAHEFEGLAEATGADLVIWGIALHNDMKQPLISLGEVLRKATTRITDQELVVVRTLLLCRLEALEIEFLAIQNVQRVFDVFSQSQNHWFPVLTNVHVGSPALLSVVYADASGARCRKTLDASSNHLRINTDGYSRYIRTLEITAMQRL